MSMIETVQDLQDLARGAVLLGTGGGGDPYVGELFVAEQIRRGRLPQVVSPDSLAGDAFVLSIAGIGAPTVIVEQLVSETTLLRLLARAEAFYGRRVDALISAEIGGANSVFPLALSAISGVPVVDADGVGRAVPQLEMTTFSIYGVKATPCLLMDDLGNAVTVDAVSDRSAEDLCRAIVTAMGSMAFSAIYPMNGRQVRECAVLGSLSLSLGIGRAIRKGRDEPDGDPFASLLSYLATQNGRTARVLFDGKVSDVLHETRDGWHWGLVTLQNLRDDGDQFTIEIRNEFIIARHNGTPVTMVPDLISVLDRESAEPLTAEMLTYGQRVKVLGFAADPMLRRPESLEVLGPRLFGLDCDFTPIEEVETEAGEAVSAE
ncbi:DUF917 domain-containing protein [Novosphingobium album (ex Hu et al. 2023)]|uniref:DUF917 domain-containing protein n=1 Tax=Novosphingobium album (ex Hu et al. 2023) TaxID=2930093 RepID=A0ABT0B7W2_9SPHN|nr:DUF917 domain-containing protein [Novosphingobium album (ex Hu et al. 2023)]MCJ2180948.1 DUF917 domain-containing protein [Novosphingobium album (ex Hu et al. 2023)]